WLLVNVLTIALIAVGLAWQRTNASSFLEHVGLKALFVVVVMAFASFLAWIDWRKTTPMAKGDFTIRIRMRLPKMGRLGYAASVARIDLPGLVEPLEIQPHSSDANIDHTSELVFETSGLSSEREAIRIGEEITADIRRTLVRIGTTADFGELSP